MSSFGSWRQQRLIKPSNKANNYKRATAIIWHHCRDCQFNNPLCFF
ncbi:hypothetical protein LINPERHAP1_LOCUS11680 [Linum perenne]